MPSKPDSIAEKRISARKVIITSFLVDFIDIILSISVAVISGSVVMYTQVLQAIADIAASGFLLIGFQRSLAKADKTHPFGYGREIYFWSLMSGIVMFGLTSSLSFYFGLQRFNSPEPVRNIPLAILVLIITFFTNIYAFVLSLRRLLRKRPLKHILPIFYRSSLVETKTTFILDLMGFSSSLMGIAALVIFVLTGDLRYDGLGAMIIGVTLGIFSVFLLAGIRDLLVGKSASRETEQRIKKAALQVKEVEGVLDLKTLHLGSEKLLVNLDVHMKARLSTRELEELIDKIKLKIHKNVPTATYIQVELETPRSRR